MFLNIPDNPSYDDLHSPYCPNCGNKVHRWSEVSYYCNSCLDEIDIESVVYPIISQGVIRPDATINPEKQAFKEPPIEKVSHIMQTKEDRMLQLSNDHQGKVYQCEDGTWAIDIFRIEPSTGEYDWDKTLSDYDSQEDCIKSAWVYCASWYE